MYGSAWGFDTANLEDLHIFCLSSIFSHLITLKLPALIVWQSKFNLLNPTLTTCWILHLQPIKSYTYNLLNPTLTTCWILHLQPVESYTYNLLNPTLTTCWILHLLPVESYTYNLLNPVQSGRGWGHVIEIFP